MARAFTAAPGLVKLMNGESWEAVGLPDVYQITEDRLQKLKGASVQRLQSSEDWKTRKASELLMELSVASPFFCLSLPLALTIPFLLLFYWNKALCQMRTKAAAYAVVQLLCNHQPRF